MSYFAHHAIVVTSWKKSLLHEAHREACTLGCDVTEIVKSRVQEFYSFCIVPDGSKEGWPESDEGDRRRAAMIAWIESKSYEDGSNSLSFVEVRFGGDEPELATIVTPAAALGGGE